MRILLMFGWRGVLALALVSNAPEALAGPFDPQVGQPGSTGAISALSPLITGWASSVVSFRRGPQDISNPSSPLASIGKPTDVLGAATGSSHLVSLGDGGSITLGFDRAIANGAGADFAVFENGFLSGGAGMALLELGLVSVSSDGVHFFEFPSISLTQTVTQVGGFSLLDASNLSNLAGKYIGGYGTGFDLQDLAGLSPLLDINLVTQVRITDVIGSIDPAYGSYDSQGHLINDPFKTPFASSGFDLSGVGVIHAAVPEPATLISMLTGLGLMGLATARRARARLA
ncbi:PEP-CTERM sorting domain-containing protein [Isosphaeraceae bacterium EP7]